MNGIEIKNISKKYGTTWALNNVNLRFEENKIYGLLGRNGAGKSTLLNILSNRIFADKGEVFVDGMPCTENDEAQSRIYLMSEKNYYPPKLTVKKALKWSKEFYSDFDTEYALYIAKLFGLDMNKSITSLSTGYQSIFKIVISLSVNTPYVLLDEPVLGLDANHRDLFYRQIIEKYSNHPCTIIISTHLIEEVSNVIEDIVILKEGHIIKNEPCQSLLRKGYAVSGVASKVDLYTQNKNILSTDSLGGLKTAYILGTLDKQTLPDGLETSKLDLQKLFIQLTNS